MSKIENLTEEQKEKLNEYRDKWLAIGLSTEKANRVEAEKGIEIAYKIAGLSKPKIVWCLSPLSSGLTRYCVLNIKKINIGDSVRDSVWDSVGDSVRKSVGDSVWDSVGKSGYGQHDANWLGFYDYFNNVLKLETQTAKLAGVWMVSKNAGWFIPHQNICWISERHNICFLKNGRIHSENGPAIAYPDGFEVYGLNGVRVPKNIVLTPADKLDSNLILSEKNAEIRREIVRKIGIEKVCKDLNSDILEKGFDHKGNPCELINLDLKDGRKRPYIKLINPSIGVYHLEGVHPDCDTLEKAFNFRNGTDLKPIILT